MKNIFRLSNIPKALTWVVTLVLFTGIAAQPLTVMAVTPSTTPTLKTTLQQDRINDLKARANNEIDRRSGALNDLLSRISGMQRLNSAQKAEFSNDIKTNINELATLKSQIATETNLTNLKAEVQSIITSYRIFALYIPKVRILSAADRELTTVASLNVIAVKLNNLIQNAQSKGLNVSGLTGTYQDMLTQIANAQTAAQAAFDEVLPLTPAGYPGNVTQLKEAAQKSKDSYQDIVKAANDAKSLRNSLKQLLGTVTPTVTPI